MTKELSWKKEFDEKFGISKDTWESSNPMADWVQQRHEDAKHSSCISKEEMERILAKEKKALLEEFGCTKKHYNTPVHANGEPCPKYQRVLKLKETEEK